MTWHQAIAVCIIIAQVWILHRRTRRIQALMHAHMKSDHTHLLVTEELMKRVADLDGKGLPEVLREEG